MKTYIVQIIGPHIFNGSKHGTSSNLLSCDLVNDWGGDISLCTGQESCTMETRNTVNHNANEGEIKVGNSGSAF